MKKITILLFSLLVGATVMNAQNADFRNVVSATAGYSLFNAVGKAAITDGTYTTASVKTTPTLQLSYDHAFGKVFSLGGAFSYNSAKANATGYEWTDANNNVSTSDIDIKVARTTIGVRTLFHYGNSGKIDMYSGLRLGLGIWNIKATSTDPDFDPENEFSNLRNGIAPQIQVIPFALRGYITNNIGIGFETAIGSPYMASLSVCYRLGGNGKK